MREATSFASLSPTLLARKGAAKPAMRPQVQPLNSNELHGCNPQDELGWNDMGDEPAEKPQAEVIAFAAAEKAAVPVEQKTPVVLRQREEAETRVEAPAPKAGKPAKPRRKAIEQGRRAAFTLRIDQERHLKLRLACTLRNRSAQQLLTEALDRYLEEQDDIADLAAQVGKAN